MAFLEFEKSWREKISLILPWISREPYLCIEHYNYAVFPGAETKSRWYVKKGRKNWPGHIFYVRLSHLKYSSMKEWWKKTCRNTKNDIRWREKNTRRKKVWKIYEYYYRILKMSYSILILLSRGSLRSSTFNGHMIR